MKDDLKVELEKDKEPYVKTITNDKVVNLIGESGSRKVLHVQTVGR